MNYINKNYFTPLLNLFLEKVEKDYDCRYYQLPFIPYTFSKYHSAERKIFYVGRDTYYWLELDALFDSSNKINHELYLERNCEYVTTDNILNDWSKAGSFWGFVGHLQLLLSKGVYYRDFSTLKEEDLDCFHEVGYGNLFSIELPETLKKKKYTDKESGLERNEYDDINDWNKYYRIKENSIVFEGLETIFKAYGEPDFVIITSWIDKDDFFKNLSDYQFVPEYYIENKLSVFTSKVHKTKVIWTSHPNRFSFLETNAKEMCELICKTINELS